MGVSGYHWVTYRGDTPDMRSIGCDWLAPAAAALPCHEGPATPDVFFYNTLLWLVDDRYGILVMAY